MRKITLSLSKSNKKPFYLPLGCALGASTPVPGAPSLHVDTRHVVAVALTDDEHEAEDALLLLILKDVRLLPLHQGERRWTAPTLLPLCCASSGNNP